MQNNVIVVCLALILRLLRNCFKQVAGMFVLRRTRAGWYGLSAISLGVDLDSSRLDAVSRSLWWGSAIPIPEPARAAGCPPLSVPRPVFAGTGRWHGAGPEIFLHYDA
jgi:hypothetical protein